jgi:hypothetical protein
MIASAEFVTQSYWSLWHKVKGAIVLDDDADKAEVVCHEPA